MRRFWGIWKKSKNKLSGRRSNFSGGTAVDGASFGEVLAFEIGANPFSQLSSVAGGEVRDFQLIASGQEGLDGLEVFAIVGNDVEQAVRLEGG